MSAAADRSEWGLDQDWEAQLRRWLDIAKLHAEAKAKRVRAEHMRTVTRSLLALSSDAKSSAAKNLEAEASPKYVLAVEELVQAVKEESILAARLEAGRVYFDMVRTEAATKRAELSMR